MVDYWQLMGLETQKVGCGGNSEFLFIWLLWN